MAVITCPGRHLRYCAIRSLLVCTIFMLSACSGVAAVESNTPGERPTATPPTAIAPTETTATGDPTTVTPAVSAPTDRPGNPAKNTKPDKAGRVGKAQPEGQTGPATQETGPFLAPEVLGRPTDRSATMNLLPAETLEVYVEHGGAPGAYTERTPVTALTGGQPVEITLDGLQPDACSYYRIRYRQPGAPSFDVTAEHSFTTQRAPDSTFTFAVQGDSHPERVGKQFDAELYVRALTNAAADRPDFFVAIGDDFSVDNLKTVNEDTVNQLYRKQREWLGLVGAPMFLINGNHEQASLANLDGTANNVAVWAQNARNAYYPQPAPDGFFTGDPEPVEHIGLLRDYYAFTWGDALFMMIDPYWHSPQTVDNQFGADRSQKAKRDLWDVTLGETQYQWMKQTLESSDAIYKFVFAHHVNGTGRGGIELADTYEWGDASGLPAHRPGWDKTIHQLLVDNGVTIFFQGHDHIFVRQELDGVIYQTLPEPANPFYTAENSDAYRSGDKFPNSGHVRVTVAPEQVTVDYIRAFLPADETDGHVNGEVAFSYTIPAEEQPPSGSSRALLPLVSGAVTPPSSQYPAAGFPGSVVLGSPTDRSVTASLLADVALDVYLEYSTAEGGYTTLATPISLLAGQPAELLMAGLQPDTPHVYRLRFRRLGETVFAADRERTFQTQRSPGSVFTFTLDADPHNRDPNFNAKVYSTTLRNALTDKPDFHIDLGDTFVAEKSAPTSYEQVAATYREMRPFFGLLVGSAPLFLVNGNHDGELGWRLNGTADNLAIWATKPRQTFYPNPTPGEFYSGSTAAEPLIGVRDGYYAWTWGDALFVVLDPFWYTTEKPRTAAENWNLTLGEAQYQ